MDRGTLIYLGMAVWAAANLIVHFLTKDDYEWEQNKDSPLQIPINTFTLWVLIIPFWTIPHTVLDIWQRKKRKTK